MNTSDLADIYFELANLNARLGALEGKATPTGESYQINYLTVRPDGTVNPLIQFGGAAGGNLSGTYPNPEVVGVQPGVIPVGDLIGSPMTLAGTGNATIAAGTNALVLASTGYAVILDPDGRATGTGGVYTTPRDGYYHLSAGTSVDTTSPSAGCDLSLQNRNNSAFGAGTSTPITGPTPAISLTLSAILFAQAGQQLGFEIKASTAPVRLWGGNNTLGDPLTFFSVMQVGSG